MKSFGKSIINLLVCVTLLYSPNLATEYQTVAEKSGFTKTSLYKDIMDLLFWAQNRIDYIKLVTLARSHEGRIIPMLVISESGIGSAYELKMTGKPAVLIQANIHAGEIEGKEASLMFIRDLVQGKHRQLLKNQVILMIPNLNVDGNEKLSPFNRRDNGPELAGTRHNGQNLDLNRDFLKLESPEIKALIGLFNEWDPVLFVDMHTKNGSYHREPITFTTLSDPNSHSKIQNYMWNKFFPEVQKILKEKYGYDSVPYGNFDRRDEEKGWKWRNDTTGARYSTNYIGLRNRFTILDENYPHVDFKTRVLSAYGLICSILEFTNNNISEMEKILVAADNDTKDNFYKGAFVLESKNEKLFDLIVKSYEFKKDPIKSEDIKKYPWLRNRKFLYKKTEKEKDYKLPYFAKAIPTRTIPLPEGYIIPPGFPKILKLLKKHGINLRRITKSSSEVNVEEFKLKEVTPKNFLYQGHIFITIKGEYQKVKKPILEDAYFISMKQPLARIIAIMLEPECEDSLAQWGFFNRVLVRQWGGRPNFYPVFRIMEKSSDLEFILE
jgi:hypothetical protein